LEENDTKENQVKTQNILQNIERLQLNKLGYNFMEKNLVDGEPQINTTSSDYRALLVQGQVVEISFNIQVIVYAKHNIVVATLIIIHDDRNVLSAIAVETKESLGIETYTSLMH
jgi:hypothetical protein